MRVFLALLLSAVVSGIGIPPHLLAREAGTVSGQVLDAGGRPLASVRVELVEGHGSRSSGSVVQVTSTGAHGAWAFDRVPRGEYVARMALNGHMAGVPVTVGESPVGRVLIVAPSIATASMQGAAAPAGGFLATLGGGSTAVGAAMVAVLAAGATVGVLAATDHSPFKDDQS